MKFRVYFAAMMSFVLAFLMTAWVTWINLGFVSDYLSRWMDAFVLAWPVAGTIAFLFGPFVQKLAHRLANTDVNKVEGR